MFVEKLKIILLMMLILAIFSIDGNPESCRKCIGEYCGRMVYDVDSSDNKTDCEIQCGICGRGYRTDSYFCRKCEKNVELYDWLFLGFVALSVTVLNFYAIDRKHGEEKRYWLHHLSVIFESLTSFISMVLYFEPTGTMQLYSCGVKSIRDWYTVFYNPRVDYVRTVRCTQEAIYPLYTSILIYLVFSLLTMILFRGFLLRRFARVKSNASLYAGFYIIPAVGAVHVCFAGIIYYVFPYFTLVFSAVGVAVFLSTLDKQIMVIFKTPRHLAVLICYCIAHAYGIISVTQLSKPVRDLPVLLLIFLPVSFFMLAKPFTASENFSS